MKLKNMLNKIISLTLAVVMFSTVLFQTALAAEPDNTIYSLKNGYIKVEVSGRTGGFHINTAEGNKLTKDDNNKMLLHNSSEYDTSFTSVRITKGGETKDYIFGRSYGFLGLSGTDLKTVQMSNYIASTWTVEGVEITQMIILNNESSDEHGMVSVNYTAKNVGEEVVDNVEIRILLDTALGYQDYAYYTVNDEQVVERECVITENVGTMMYGYDNKENPKIVAYSVNGISEGRECVPSKIAFGHWNNLASSVFDFEPNPDMTFTNEYNVQYLTADSAYALYYDIGTLDAGGTRSIGTNYGVYSNIDVAKSARVAMNVNGAAPLSLNEDKTAYISSNPDDPEGEFSLNVLLENFAGSSAGKLENINVVVYPDNGIIPLDDQGEPINVDSSNPHSISIYELAVGDTVEAPFRFKAEVAEKAKYRKIRFVTYLPSDSGQYLQDDIIGEQEVYILCPGSDNGVPDVSLTGCSEYVYYTGARRKINLTGLGFEMLEDKGEYNFTLRQVAADGAVPKEYTMDSALSAVNAEDGTGAISLPENLMMDLGTYNLIINYVNEDIPDVVSEAAKVVVTDNVKYKPSERNVIAIVQPDSEVAKYDFRFFDYEEEFEEYRKETSEEILVNVKGCFNTEPFIDDRGERYNDHVYNNSITINDTLDVRKGFVEIRKIKNDNDNYTFLVEINGYVYMSGVDTLVSIGIATLTEISDGIDYELIHYTTDGIRCDTLPDDDPRQHRMAGKQPITYIFSEMFEKFVNIANIVNADFTYLQLGQMVDINDNYMFDVVSVSAKIDLGLFMPKGNKEYKQDFDSAWKSFKQGVEASPSNLRSCWREFSQSEEAQSYAARRSQGQIMLCAEVDDIIFGNDQFLGVNFSVEVGLPSMTSAMPGMNGVLTVNTMGDWRFGVDGTFEFVKIIVDGTLEIIYSDELNAPIPNTIYFSLTTPPPGLNIDGLGVLWLRGGGGGIKNLYEAVYSPSTLPSTSLVMTINASIIKVLLLQVTTEIGLHGISLVAERGTLLETDIQVLRNSGLRLQWYPSFKFSANVNFDFLKVLNGNAYIVINPADESYEFFGMFSVMIPPAIPLIGGRKIASAGMGINEKKIWGKITIIGLTFGVLYYWGGDFSFVDSDGPALQPSYPELLSAGDVPVAYDEDTGRTLYAHVVPNYSLQQRAMITNLLNAPTNSDEAVLLSNADRLNHRLNLGTYQASKTGALSIRYEAATMEIAEMLARGIKITSENNSNEEYEIVFLAEDESNADTANAFLTYDEENKTAKVVVSFIGEKHYAKPWKIVTKEASDLEIYGVNALPAFNMTESKINGENVEIKWGVSDNNTAALDKISVYLTETNDPKNVDGIYVGSITDKETLKTGSATLEIPVDTLSGSYYIKTIASLDDESLIDTRYSDQSFGFTNSSQPAQPESVTVSNAGDYRLRVNAKTGESDFDGYSVKVYEVSENGEMTVYTEVDNTSAEFEKDDDIVVGGRYEVMPEQNDENAETKETVYAGLEAGKRYVVGVSLINNLTDDEGNITGRVFSEEKFSDTVVTLNTPNPPAVTLRIAGKDGSEAVNITSQAGGETVSVPTVAEENAVVKVTSNQPINGRWYLNDTDYESAEDNGGKYGTFNNQAEFTIDLSELESQGHMLHIDGTNVQGDGFTQTLSFAVDTIAPSLAVSSPVNGDVANDDLITVSGVTDLAARLSVNFNGRDLGTKTAEEWDANSENGSFEFTIGMNGDDKKLYKNKLTLTASDSSGNKTEYTYTIVNERITELKEVAIAVGGEQVSGGRIDASEDVLSDINLLGITKSGESFVLNSDDTVKWNIAAVDGSARIYEAGETSVDGINPNTNRMLSIDKSSKGYLVGELQLTAEAGISVAAEFGVTDTHTITYIAENGATVSGPAEAKPGAQVEISVSVPLGYQFIGWKSVSGDVEFNNASATETTFTMPDNSVVIEAVTEGRPINKESLQQEITEAEAALSDAKISTDGRDVLKSKLWTTQERADALQAVIDAAKETLNKELATDEEILKAMTELETEYKTFTDSCQQGKRSSGGGSGTSFSYTVTFNTQGGGEIDSVHVSRNGTVAEPEEPTREGYIFEGWFTDENCTQAYDFAAGVTKNITLYAKWTEETTEPTDPADPSEWNPFTDVAESDWFYENVRYAYENNLFGGTSATTFEPNTEITRGMLVTVLWRAENQPVVNYLMPFDDVDEGAYYGEAIRWAASEQLVSGYSETEFAPDRQITREEMAAIINRYADYKGMETVQTGDLTQFSDTAEISDWAAENVSWAVGNGILSGKGGGILDPQGDATRAETAAILQRLLEK